jgi:hypothetical protein
LCEYVRIGVGALNVGQDATQFIQGPLHA